MKGGEPAIRSFHETRKYRTDLPVTVRNSKNINFLAHWHSDIEMVFVLDGSLRMGINNEVRVLKSGDFAICSSRDIHYYDSKNLESQILMLIFRPDLVDCPGGWPRKARFDTPFIDKKYIISANLPTDLLTLINENINYLQKEITEKKTAYKSLVKSKLLEICGLAERYIPAIPPDYKSKHRRLHNISRMQDVLGYIEEKYTSDISLEETARNFNFSISHFSRLFKSTVGMGFTSYVNAKRVYKAESLLLDSSQSISQIAMECGFDSIRTFNRVFKSVMGITPSGMR